MHISLNKNSGEDTFNPMACYVSAELLRLTSHDPPVLNPDPRLFPFQNQIDAAAARYMYACMQVYAYNMYVYMQVRKCMLMSGDLYYGPFSTSEQWM